MGEAGSSLIEAFDHVWHRFGVRLDGLTDEEYFWEPVAGCWSLRVGPGGRWALDGGGGGGPAPEPVPFTTIAWRIGHVAGGTLGGFADRLFGDGSLVPRVVEYPTTVTTLDGFLAENYARWRHGMATLDAAGWAEPLGSSWGLYADSNRVDLALHVFDEVVHHTAEVGVLRDLFEHRATLKKKGDPRGRVR
ncbi:MAG TPA: DinB family protein [Acidimicrobiales bacterium]